MLDHIRTNLAALKADDRGVTALEYAIIAGVLGIALIGIFTSFSGTLTTLFSSIGGEL
jgi:pilus assembly protein Flp/PilA